MSASSFDFAKLQLQHPDAFFCKLGYSRYKFTNIFQNIRLLLLSQLFVLFTMLCCSVLSFSLYQQNYFTSPHQSMNVGAMQLLALLYLYVWWNLTRARYSSSSIANRLQTSLYILMGIFAGLAINFYWLQSEIINVIALLGMTLSSFCAVLIEPNFKVQSRATDWVKLQKIRQLAYWSYRQSKSKKPQAVAKQCNLQRYYAELHKNCMQQEQILLEKIQHKGFKDSFLEE